MWMSVMCTNTKGLSMEQTNDYHSSSSISYNCPLFSKTNDP